jgi:hypothetical protein
MSCGDFAGRDVFGTGDEVSPPAAVCSVLVARRPLRLGSFDPWQSEGRRFSCAAASYTNLVSVTDDRLGEVH